MVNYQAMKYKGLARSMEVLSCAKLTDFLPDWSEVSANVSHKSMMYTLENSCLLMGASQLSNSFGFESFNISLLDQD